jgi:superfamily II DNA/RNA helicase
MIQSRKSIIARAKNGTGKTGAFLIPLLNEIDENASTIQGTTILNFRSYLSSNEITGTASAVISSKNIEIYKIKN